MVFYAGVEVGCQVDGGGGDFRRTRRLFNVCGGYADGGPDGTTGTDAGPQNRFFEVGERVGDAGE